MATGPGGGSEPRGRSRTCPLWLPWASLVWDTGGSQDLPQGSQSPRNACHFSHSLSLKYSMCQGLCFGLGSLTLSQTNVHVNAPVGQGRKTCPGVGGGPASQQSATNSSPFLSPCLGQRPRGRAGGCGCEGPSMPPQRLLLTPCRSAPW